jgi:DNA-binding MarR family transcriptional regulator
MQGVEHNGYEELTLLELVLQLHGEFRRILEPFRVTPLQAGVLLFIRRHANARVTDAAAAFRLRLPTLSEVVKALARKRWVTKRRSVKDDRVVVLSLSRWGDTLALQIEKWVHQVNVTLAKQDRRTFGMISKDSRA